MIFKMNDNVTISQCNKESDNNYNIIFDNGEKLNFTSDEVMEYGLYCENKIIDNFFDFCTLILSKRMMAANASYVLFSNKTSFQVKKKLEVYVSEGNIDLQWLPYGESAINKALDRLEELGYIDDEAYAYKYANSALCSKCSSKNAVLNELVYKKGISRDIAEKAIEDIYSKNDDLETDNLYKLLKKKIKSSFPQDKNSEAKIYRYAISKGFSYNDIERALDKIKREAEESDE